MWGIYHRTNFLLFLQQSLMSFDILTQHRSSWGVERMLKIEENCCWCECWREVLKNPERFFLPLQVQESPLSSRTWHACLTIAGAPFTRARTSSFRAWTIAVVATPVSASTGESAFFRASVHVATKARCTRQEPRSTQSAENGKMLGLKVFIFQPLSERSNRKWKGKERKGNAKGSFTN